MTTTSTPLEDIELGSALAALWQRHRQTNLDRISLLESTAAMVLRGVIDDEALAEGTDAAHKLAGSLGTFGFDAGSRAALEAEFLLREPSIDGRLLAEAVIALRSSVEEVGDASRPEPGRLSPIDPSAAVDAHLASIDTDLISRLTLEAAAIGLAIASTDQLPSADVLQAVPTSIIVDDEVPRVWTRADMLQSVSELSRTAPVIVLTDREGFEDRLELARAGAAGVIPRSQGAPQIIEFLAEVLAQQKPRQAAVLAMATHTRLVETLADAVSPLDCHLEVRDEAPEFWHDLEARGADLAVVGSGRSQLSGADMCRMIRGHPRWHRLPVIVIGEHDPRYLREALDAGADDFLHTNVSPHELGVRVRHHLDRGRLAQARCDIDPLTGAENPTAAKRSLDHMLRLATRGDEPLALALITIDQLEQIRAAEGNVMGDVVLHRLGLRLLGEFGREDLVGRWTNDAFVVGARGATSDQASERIIGVLREFSTERFPTTSGNVMQCTFSAGAASFPLDGLSLSSLERLSETALRRAMAGQNRVVVAGERPKEGASDLVDVVLVEDDDSVADVIEHALGLRHYSFLRFSDGADAARALGEGHVKSQIVLLDVGLPSLDGFGVLQVLRSQGVLADSHVIMLTARSSEAEMLRALGLGATEHITKPFSVPVLLGRLDQTRARVNA